MHNDEKKRVTIYSVAHEAGVSLATVSRVINDSDVVKEDTKRKVQDAIIKLGYKPNAVAQGLALKRTTTIALVIPDSSFLYIGKTLNGLLDTAKIYKYNITIHTVTSGINEMDDIVENVVKSRVDGIVVYNDSLDENDLNTLNSYQIPIVCIGNKISNSNVCCAYVDYKQGIYELVNRYLDKGKDDIVIIQDRKNPTILQNIISGTEKAFAQHGKKFDGYIRIPDQYHSSYEFLKKYFSLKKHEVIITLRDSQAFAVVNTCNENGISVPEDTEVVTVLDSRYTEMFRPQISSFVIPSYDLGSLGMRVMTKMLNGEEVKEKEYKLEYIYKERKSTKK